MKLSEVIRAAVTAKLSKQGITLAKDVQLALDAAVEEETKKAEDEEEEEARKKAEDEAKQKAEDAAKMSPQPAGTPAAMDAATVDRVIASKGYVTRADADKLAADAANAAVVRINALHKARKDVEPLVGIVAFDSAEEVYRFALDQAKVALDGVPSAAYGALVEQVKAARAAKAAPGAAAPKFAADAASAAEAAIPGLARFGIG
jgi:hypothetical protein